MRKTLIVAVSAFALMASSPALAQSKTSKLVSMPPAPAAAAPKAPALPPVCANTDVQFGATFATSCTGFYARNTIQSTVDAEDIGYLALLAPPLTGLVNGQAFLVKLDSLASATNLTFTGFNFYGLTYFGAHFGGGGARPGENSSAYYVVDYGTTGGNTLHLNLNASSNIAVYSTRDRPFEVPTVPEPATWAMMIMGFGGVGSLLRRRRHALSAV